MTPRESGDRQRSRNLEEVLIRLDLAQETLEGLDELEVTTREELVALMNALEAEIGEDVEPAP